MNLKSKGLICPLLHKASLGANWNLNYGFSKYFFTAEKVA